MIEFPNAKINLGLRVLDKRPDGYHNISTVMYPVTDLCDVLEIIESKELNFECEGPYSKGLNKDNLCLKAYELLNNDYHLPPVHVYLYKNIPVGAGLGGGSADAAFLLKMINVIFSLGLNEQRLEHYAGILGSDCPFFIKNQAAYCSGRGEIMQSINVNLSDYKIDIKVPDVSINTAWAYKELERYRAENQPHKGNIDDIIKSINKGPEEWNGILKNDFEIVITKLYPQILQLKDKFEKDGAIFSAMSGSGSSIFAIKKTY